MELTKTSRPALAFGVIALVATMFGGSAAWSNDASGSPVGTESGSVTPIVMKHPTSDLPTIAVKGMGEASSDRLDGAVLADIKLLAESRGDTVEGWVAREAQTTSFRGLTSDYASKAPDDYLASGTVAGADGQYSGWITLASKPSATMIEDLQGLPIDVEVRYGIPDGIDALRELQAEITSDVQALLPKGGRVESHLNDQTGVVEVNYDSPSALDEAIVAESVRGAKRSVGRAESVEVSVVRAEVGKATDTTVVHGGSGLYYDNESVCTAGFSAKIPNGSSGIITADHCDYPLLFQNIGGAIQIQIHSVANTDMEFFKTLTANGHTTEPEFFKGNETRTVTGKLTPAVGDPVCRYGFVSGLGLNACNVIDSVNHCYTTDWGQGCGIVYTDTFNVTFGDSGGPNFWGSKAVGIIKGFRPVQGLGTVSTFTSINLATTELGVNILTCPGC